MLSIYAPKNMKFSGIEIELLLELFLKNLFRKVCQLFFLIIDACQFFHNVKKTEISC